MSAGNASTWTGAWQAGQGTGAGLPKISGARSVARHFGQLSTPAEKFVGSTIFDHASVANAVVQRPLLVVKCRHDVADSKNQAAENLDAPPSRGDGPESFREAFFVAAFSGATQVLAAKHDQAI